LEQRRWQEDVPTTTTRDKGHDRIETRTPATLSREKADAARLLKLTREHWGIKNGLHYTRDETLGEDRCRLRKERAAHVLASWRNVAVHLLRRRKAKSMAAAARQLAAHPLQALDLLTDPGPISE